MRFSAFLLRTSLLGLFVLSSLLNLSAADYYWIGGTGNWSDISHWATTSGGVTTHAQAPGSDDDVYFDANSFTGPGQTVTLNTDIIFCRNLDWRGATGTPTFTGGRSVTVMVYGSLELIPAMTYTMNGSIVFTGDLPDNTVNFSANLAGTNLTFSGGGDWTLTGPVAVDSTLFFNEGTLSTDGQPVTTGYFRSDTDASRTLNLGASRLTIRKNTWRPYPEAYATITWPSLWIDARNLTLDAGTSTVTLRGNRTDLYFEGPGTLAFNEVVLDAAMGNSRLIRWGDQNGFGTEPTVSFARLDLFHRTELSGSYAFDQLELHPGQQYRFRSGDTFTIGDLVAVGDCQGDIDLGGTDAGTPAIFTSSAPITADFVTLSSLQAGGAGSFTANNAIDLGGNTGWTLNQRPTSDFYWIGGTGNWNDPMHWSATSGGPASGCVPSLADDVYFDGNSFSATGQTVNVNIENAGCRNMSWAAATFRPFFAGPDDHRMRVAGSLAFTQNMEHTFAGSYFFTSSMMGNTLTSAGQDFNQDVTFEGSGEWTLTDSLHVEYFLYFRSGTLRTNDQAVNTNFFWANTSDVRELYLGGSYITLESRNNIYFYSEMQLLADNLTFDAGTSVIEFTGGYNGGLYAYGNGALTLNVVLFSSTYGSLYQSIFDPANPSPLAVDSLLYYNSGSLGGENNINYLYFQPGRTYELANGSTQNITELDAGGSCDAGHTNIIHSYPETTSSISLPPGQSFDRLFLQGITVTGGAPAIANNSVDGGGNSGWTINEEASRTLYWVGGDGDGDWFDRAHWSLTSGGMGGECVPTPIDDVIFDEGSPLSPGIGFSVINGTTNTVFCHNIDWTAGLTVPVYFQVNQLRVAGSFTNRSTALNFQSNPVIFYGAEDQTITTGGIRFYQFIMRPTGTYTFLDDLEGEDIVHQTGTVNFANQLAELRHIRVEFSVNPKFLNLGSTHFKIYGETDPYIRGLYVYSDSKVTIDPGTSLLEFTGFNADIDAGIPINLNNVLFSNAGGNGKIQAEFVPSSAVMANAVVFNGNGQVDLAMTTDTLIMAPGKSYVFRANKTQFINKYWQVIGNNCTPISLQSSILGTAATASMPVQGEILADFIQMRDITGVGGASFLAGSRSTDIANSNLNWVFETAPEFETVGFLGEDQTLCAGGDVTLNAYNFSPGETYRWQDGSTDTTFTASAAGTYAVEVTFQTSCVIRDSITVLDAADFEVALPDDPVICAGDTLILSGDAGINSADYLWQDGSTSPTLAAFATGFYKLVVDLGGCEKSDSTLVTVTDLPTVTLGQDQVACDQEDFTLTANVSAESFQWQDGSTGTTFTNDQPGFYWVEALNGACPVRDSVEVTYVTPTTVDLGTDTTLCVANQFTLNAGAPGYDYTWQDGSGGQNFTAVASGQYFVEIDTAGCTSSDTINLVFPDLPVIDVVDGYEICDGETFRLVTQTPADAIRWDNGQNGSEFVVTVGGNFSVSMDFGTCTVDKPFQVDFLAPPVVELGPDVTECEGIPVVLDAGMTGVWQDGSTAATFSTLMPGEFKVVVTDGPCMVADSLNVTFLAAPEFSLGDDQLACEGEVLNVAVTPNNLGIIFWDDGLDVANRSFTSSVLHWVEVEDANGCITRDSVQLTFQAPPELELGQDTTVCDDRPYLLTPLAGPGNLSWPDGSASPEFEVISPGPLVATLDDGVCLVRDTVIITQRECLDFKAYMPTAFSPNFDGVNDEFRPGTNPRIEIISYRMEVFDRWGGLRFASDDITNGWDGMDAGQAVEMGVYLYSIELTYRDDRGVGSAVIGGDVTVIK
ncbi:T9SS type B sorting domain-containing protein [Neolewinella persica]|uniref:T9SS type B sorting domain-containing protein n=1 Tax=Neolewinella persica TaxID=70998 RepID=UPI0003736E09|nr:gliding motility-associated C-terminal domain-containing protein [Neolewinella persica]